jgi:processive 1,2-diacylglycerol beta-glucosyltransferase
MQLICVCGNNKKAKEEIDAQSFTHRVLNFGYTDKIDLLMDAADCIVTKPGGLTTSEALAKRLPMIIANPIPGHEDRNAEFLLNSGAAAMASKTARLTDVVYQLFYHPERLEQMRANIDLIRKPNAAADLITLIESLDKPKA